MSGSPLRLARARSVSNNNLESPLSEYIWKMIDMALDQVSGFAPLAPLRDTIYDPEQDWFHTPLMSTIRLNFFSFLCEHGVLLASHLQEGAFVKNPDAFRTSSNAERALASRNGEPNTELIYAIMKWYRPEFLNMWGIDDRPDAEAHRVRLVAEARKLYYETHLPRLVKLRTDNYRASEQHLRAKARVSKNIVLYVGSHGYYITAKNMPLHELDTIDFQDPARTFNHVQIAPVGTSSYSSSEEETKSIQELREWPWNRKLQVANLREFATRLSAVFRVNEEEVRHKKDYIKQIYYDTDKMGRMTITQGKIGAQITNKRFMIDQDFYSCLYVDDAVQPPTVRPFFPFRREHWDNSEGKFWLRDLLQSFYGMGFLNVVLIDSTCSVVQHTDEHADEPVVQFADARSQRNYRRIFMQSQNNISDEDYDRALAAAAAPRSSSRRRQNRGGTRTLRLARARSHNRIRFSTKHSR